MHHDCGRRTANFRRLSPVNPSIADVIGRIKKAGRKNGICSQAASDYSEFAEFLVQCGIDSLSLTAYTVLATPSAGASIGKAVGALVLDQR